MRSFNRNQKKNNVKTILIPYYRKKHETTVHVLVPIETRKK